ncbi:hypothetical protein D0C36_22585 [Mucilaginibacter conchicola]|uniref:histidine kinase n=1 Tax=Mucilaginibacter conchicola TaxID=2303333 RepID=A0A372NN51_9SPHI|nr:histidine kinase dimerization/phosphoacceptor domain -containing protein [Mucilaginibacter conchicola]RFZ90037.1 hypothetical protein D0C36_22585 [Mucilaginibacter conchicola]
MNTVRTILSCFLLLAGTGLVQGQDWGPVFNQILAADSICRTDPRKDPKPLFLPIIKKCQSDKNIEDEGYAWQYLAANIKNVTQALAFKAYCLQNALQIKKRLKDQQSEYNVLRNIADIHLQQDKLVQAESELLQITRPGSNASHDNLMYSCDLLAAVYIEKGSYQKALEYSLRSLKMMKTPADSANIITFHGRLSGICMVLGNVSESLSWSRKTLSYCLSKKKYSCVPQIRGTIVTGMIAQRNAGQALKFLKEHSSMGKFKIPDDQRLLNRQLGDCYSALHKTDKAEGAYEKMLWLIRHQNDFFPEYEVGYSYYRIGQFYMDTQRPQKAKIYLLSALSYFGVSSTTRYRQAVYALLFKADSTAGNFKSALKYYRLSKVMLDSVVNTDKNRKIEELLIAFHNEQKEKNIKQLKNEAAVERLRLKNAGYTRVWVAFGCGLLLLTIGMLIKHSRSVMKANILLKMKKQSLAISLHEKEWLLKEVHDRVKNNLQTIISLFESQAKYLSDEALTAIEVSQQRIYAMSLIHHQLYRSDDIRSIDLALYIPILAENLIRSFGVSGRIFPEFMISKVDIDISEAIPICLIINEAMTNAIKHAFTEQRQGKISILLEKNDGKIIIVIADNGIGLCLPDNAARSSSLGIELMRGLCADINGKLLFEISGGTRITISFESVKSSAGKQPAEPL